ncbi:helix-turn-helix domain-containing protein [Mesosutterella sp. OilRF-GAM-744-9]|uniref:Helix-turn-helix domain-containing protein n=1 Tax=Mesosutterella porci TaxID=2915351 RepID=A0ABS9MRA9_9BURK|nr:helix-turn-helix domain-containing protein [Mesosutterella sp. oilRF-744-WT-GAM-9]MCG5031052.1 helix-turn-helix domain-containing protein [Mesosutterella sp. oilRF-744-WT-GAM-9]
MKVLYKRNDVYVAQGITFERMFSPQQVCLILGVCRNTLYNWTKDLPGFPQPVRVTSRTLRYRASDIESFLGRNKEEGGGA